MIFDEITLNILKNFSTINPSILVKPGNVITTVNKGPTMFGRATVPLTFEREFAIMELTRFLSCLSIFGKPEVEFTDKHAIIKNEAGTGRINYTLASPNAILARPDAKFSVKEVDVSFVMPQTLYEQINKAQAVIQSDEIMFYSDNGTLKVKALKANNPSENTFEWDICECDHFPKQYKIDVENFKSIMPGEYNCHLDTRGMINFSRENLDYLILVKAK
jgi:hypothetical protein